MKITINRERERITIFNFFSFLFIHSQLKERILFFKLIKTKKTKNMVKLKTFYILFFFIFLESLFFYNAKYIQKKSINIIIFKCCTKIVIFRLKKK